MITCENCAHQTKVITRGNCMICGKELTEGLFFCKECENKANNRKRGDIKTREEAKQLPKINGRKFEEIVVQYPPAELCTYPEYRGKPYFSIKYEENGEHIIGFGTYNPEVLSRYLREYFIAPTPIIEADKAESEVENDRQRIDY